MPLTAQIVYVHSTLCLSRGHLLTKVCEARINYLKLSCFLHYPLTVWSHISTGCSQGGKVTLGNYVPLNPPKSFRATFVTAAFKLSGDDLWPNIHHMPQIPIITYDTLSWPYCHGSSNVINLCLVALFKALVAMAAETGPFVLGVRCRRIRPLDRPLITWPVLTPPPTPSIHTI